MENINVKVISTKQKQFTEFSGEYENWGQLLSKITEDYDMSNLSPVVKSASGNMIPVGADTKLPEGDLKVYLRPKETKAGAATRTELATIIKVEGQGLKNFIKAESGKNWTNISTDQLRTLIHSYDGNLLSGNTQGAVSSPTIGQYNTLMARIEALDERVEALENGVAEDNDYEEEDEEDVIDEMMEDWDEIESAL